MTLLRCPECGVELMEHEAKACLNAWVQRSVMQPDCEEPPLLWRVYSSRIDAAWTLMARVWEMDEDARIAKNEIIVTRYCKRDGTIRRIAGPTFPLRVCRAAIWLAAQKKETA